MFKLPSLLLLALLFAAAAVLGQSPTSSPQAKDQNAFQQNLARARAAYFRDLQGDSTAGKQATGDFHALLAAHPRNPVAMAYSGSLLLLKAAHTLAFWNKRTLAQQGLDELDKAVAADPDNLEVRFIRGASTRHLPFFFHRKGQAEHDLTYVALRATNAVKNGRLPPRLGAAALDYYGKILLSRSLSAQAQKAFRQAVSIDPDSPAGRDAASRLSPQG